MDIVTKSMSPMKNLKLGMFVKIFGSTMFTTFVWEHIGRKYNIWQRPSTAIQGIADCSRKIFTKFGALFAMLSNYLNHINLRKLGTTCHDLVKPTFDLVVSPIYALDCYFGIAEKCKSKEDVYVGSILLLVVTTIGCYKFRKNIVQFPGSSYTTLSKMFARKN